MILRGRRISNSARWTAMNGESWATNTLTIISNNSAFEHNLIVRIPGRINLLVMLSPPHHNLLVQTQDTEFRDVFRPSNRGVQALDKRCGESSRTKPLLERPTDRMPCPRTSTAYSVSVFQSNNVRDTVRDCLHTGAGEWRNEYGWTVKANDTAGLTSEISANDVRNISWCIVVSSPDCTWWNYKSEVE